MRPYEYISFILFCLFVLICFIYLNFQRTFDAEQLIYDKHTENLVAIG